jgi:hypothetical protein
MIDLLGLLEDKEKVIKWLADIETESKEAYEMLYKARETINDETELKEIKTHLRNTMLAMSKLSINMFNITGLLLLYVSGDDYADTVTKLLIKSGKGKEALRARFADKLKIFRNGKK